MKTKHTIKYSSAPYGHIATIPAGSTVIPADNLPQGGYWVEPWQGISQEAASWLENYGFLLESSDVEA